MKNAMIRLTCLLGIGLCKSLLYMFLAAKWLRYKLKPTNENRTSYQAMKYRLEKL